LFCSKNFNPKVLHHETVDGDLDGDKIPEKVIVQYKDLVMGNLREIQILKKVITMDDS
jgi:hypothetical protein